MTGHNANPPSDPFDLLRQIGIPEPDAGAIQGAIAASRLRFDTAPQVAGNQNAAPGGGGGWLLPGGLGLAATLVAALYLMPGSSNAPTPTDTADVRPAEAPPPLPTIAVTEPDVPVADSVAPALQSEPDAAPELIARTEPEAPPTLAREVQEPADEAPPEELPQLAATGPVVDTPDDLPPSIVLGTRPGTTGQLGDTDAVPDITRQQIGEFEILSRREGDLMMLSLITEEGERTFVARTVLPGDTLHLDDAFILPRDGLPDLFLLQSRLGGAKGWDAFEIWETGIALSVPLSDLVQDAADRAEVIARLNAE